MDSSDVYLITRHYFTRHYFAFGTDASQRNVS
jgi:hypothetical protein